MPIIVIVIAGSAPDLRSGAVHQGNDGVICNAAAFDAMVVDNVAQSLFVHCKNVVRQAEYIKIRRTFA